MTSCFSDLWSDRMKSGGEFLLSELTDCARSGVPIERDEHFMPERLSHVMSRKG